MSRFHFFILVLPVSISGFSQGMLPPVISIIFETNGESAAINGLHATGLYIGVLLASLFMEAPLRKLGFKPLIVIGGSIVIVSLFGFIWLQSVWIWFLLRLFIGIGDHMLHFSTQTWVTSMSSKQNRGRNLSIYGLSFGLGFAAGPFMVPLVKLSPASPLSCPVASVCLRGFLFSFYKMHTRKPVLTKPNQTIVSGGFIKPCCLDGLPLCLHSATAFGDGPKRKLSCVRAPAGNISRCSGTDPSRFCDWKHYFSVSARHPQR